ncbi:erythromycin esterase family protein [Pedobacter aquatilis]|uniref:erythromycin esterase family protein n=1 Tax=Pedobacter aquatilis TaxID=351343 RepID=UPI0029314D3E|nr:erythromycin esterase family protein [Pedobacter aquatilis]
MSIVKSIDKVIKPIFTLRPDSTFGDIFFLKQLLRNKEIIALGEVTHGTKEDFQYKDRLVRFLVSNLNYKTIVFEADNASLEDLNNYINGKIDSAHMSPSFRPLFEGLRGYNKGMAEDGRVQLYGLESREFSPSINKILVSNPNLSEDDKKIFIEFKSTTFDKIDKKQLSRCRAACTRLPQNLDNKMLIQLIDNYYKFIGKKTSKIGVRDALMAENAFAIKALTNDKKMIIWAHNGHVAKTSLYGEPPMGEFIYNKYKEKYYVIAADMNKGYVRVMKFIAKNKPVGAWEPLYYPEVDSDEGYEYYFKQFKYKNFILDVHEALADEQLNMFLSEPKEMRMIGALSVPVNKKLSIGNSFDMIVYFDKCSSTK